MTKKLDIKPKKNSTESFATLRTESVVPQPITEELSTSYLDYAMSVIVSRALPDARDGLKPVHRRILYAMWDNGLKAAARFKKSAFIVGEVLGKYHPHGDVAVYDALVRMAQDFSMRYPLIQGQGNFGSMDGDSPAAMRYTESKLAKIAESLLEDLEKQTIPFIPNYDGTQKEPQVLPATLPNLLLNGTTGIAVGMATSVPPNNLLELVDATIHIINQPNCDTKDLFAYVKGPDFPTGGIIYGRKSIEQAYSTGYGPIVMRAKTDIEETNNGFEILVSEIPYQVNKSTLILKMAELVKDKKVEGIKDIRDESNKDGVRIVIELKKDAYPKKILNQLFQHTDLQTTFHVNILALVDGLQPKVLNLKEALEEYIKHRNTVVRNRTQFDLTRAKDRAHILEGLYLCLDKIDAVIKVIRGAEDRDDARQELIKKFRLTEVQANAILDMKLANLAHLERLKIEAELKEKRNSIKELTELLKDNKEILSIIKTELLTLKEKFTSPRRTQIVAGELGSFSQEDLIPDEAAIVMLTKDGYIKRMSPEIFKTQGRGGKGVIGLAPKEEDVVDQLITSSTLTNLLFFTTRGRVFQLKAYEVPQLSRTARGQAVQNFLNLGPEEKVSTLISFTQPKELKFLVMVTKRGVIKKVALDAFQNVKRGGLITIKLKGNDLLNWVKTSSGSDEIMITTVQGQAIRFSEHDIRPMGRNASGVRGVRLKGKDEVVGMDVVSKAEQPNAKWLVISSKGFGKLSPIKTYRVQGRGGSGIKTAKVTDKTGAVTKAFKIDEKNLPEGATGDLLIISTKGQTIRIPLKSLSTQSRVTQGTRLMRFKDESDEVASIAVV